MSEQVVIDIISDVVCPWCYVGKKHIEKALENMPELDAVIRWHPFQLDPSIPLEGYDRKAYMA
jgi:predicted DsbA family dithiol-disulfide isomerase